MFESRDFVGHWYFTEHGRELSAKNANAITASFIQGREYFKASDLSGTNVSPLLLYYGVLSISRGLILIKSRNKTEDALKSSHGLGTVDWGGTLAEGIRNILDVKVRAKSGAFAELIDAVGNAQWTGCWSGAYGHPRWFTVSFPKPNFITDNSILSLDDLLSRDHRLLALYSKTTKRVAKVHLGEVIERETGVGISLYASFENDNAVRTKFGQPDYRVISRREFGDRLQIYNTHFFIITDNIMTLRSTLPSTHFIGGNECFIVENMLNGDRISELLRTYLLAYILGMLVRYHPSIWMSLIRNEKGDAALPCIRAASRVIYFDFPRLAVEALNHYAFPGQPTIPLAGFPVP